MYGNICFDNGGLVLAAIILKKFAKPVSKADEMLKVNNHSVVGIILSFVQSLAMLPVYSQMDGCGRVINAAFSVCSACVIGGQMAAYMVNKLLCGLLGVLIALFVCRKKANNV